MLHKNQVAHKNIRTRSHAIAKMTARCAQYMSVLKIVGLCKLKISRWLCKNLHITILSLIRRWNYLWSIPLDVITARSSDLNVTDGQTCVASPRCKNRETNYRRYHRYHNARHQPPV